MTKHELQKEYVHAMKLLELLGYDIQQDVNAQFLKRYQEIVLNPAPKNKGGRPKGYRKKVKK
jgi:hypothetical protein